MSYLHVVVVITPHFASCCTGISTRNLEVIAGSQIISKHARVLVLCGGLWEDGLEAALAGVGNQRSHGGVQFHGIVDGLHSYYSSLCSLL